MNRKKRRNDNINLSLDKFIDENEKNTISNFISYHQTEELSHLLYRYLGLLTPLQRKVAELIMDGRDKSEIKNILNLSDTKYDMVFKRMCDEKKVNVLNLLKGERK